MNEHEYFHLRAKIDARAASLDRLADYVKNIDDLDNATGIGTGSAPAEVPLSDDDGDMLVDLVNNTSSALIMSDKALGVLQEEGELSSDVEIVPIKILDKRGRPVPKQYAIVNPLTTVDCLDVSKSDAVVADDGEVLSLYEINIFKDKIPDDARFFRIGEFPGYVLLRGDLLHALQSKGLTGLRGVAMGEEVYE